jgi:hypothetical protein
MGSSSGAFTEGGTGLIGATRAAMRFSDALGAVVGAGVAWMASGAAAAEVAGAARVAGAAGVACADGSAEAEAGLL